MIDQDAQEYKALSTETSWFLKQPLKPHNFNEICQCGTERVIKRSTDPKRMRASLLSLVFFDQFIDTHYPEVHAEYRAEFPAPMLRGHSCGGHVSPSWFVYSRHGFDKKADWTLVSDTFSHCAGHARQWLRHKYGKPVPELKKRIESEVVSKFAAEHRAKFTVPNSE